MTPPGCQWHIPPPLLHWHHSQNQPTIPRSPLRSAFLPSAFYSTCKAQMRIIDERDNTMLFLSGSKLPRLLQHLDVSLSRGCQTDWKWASVSGNTGQSKNLHDISDVTASCSHAFEHWNVGILTIQMLVFYFDIGKIMRLTSWSNIIYTCLKLNIAKSPCSSPWYLEHLKHYFFPFGIYKIKMFSFFS